MPESEGRIGAQRAAGDEAADRAASEQSAIAMRQRWLGLLARAEESTLEAAWSALADPPRYEVLRRPEVGLVMVRGRTGGNGRPFNLGEMTATRCAVRLEGGALGVGHVAGRKPRQAELIALFDGLLQDETRRPGLEASLLAGIAANLAAKRAAAAAKTAATKVDFFTMVRGD